MPLRALATLPGLGLGTTDQAEPLQDSVKVLAVPPTAVHEFAAMQLTPFSGPPLAVGIGLGTTDQVVPFQDSINGSSVRVLVMYPPTATQASAATQETPPSSLVDPLRGLGTTDHTVPFQDSIRGRVRRLVV